MDTKKRHILEQWQILAALLMLYDMIAIMFSYFVALWARFDFVYTAIPESLVSVYIKTIAFYAIACILVFWVTRLYRIVWRFAGVREVAKVVEMSIGLSLLYAIISFTLCGRMPLSFYLWGGAAQLILVVQSRLSYRFILLLRSVSRKADETVGRVMLIGAGSAGQMILRDINRTEEINDKVVCCIDDNPNKWGRFIEGVPIVGGRDDILTNVRKYHITKIYLAIPSASAEDRKEIIGICNVTDCQLKQLPGMYQFVLNEVRVGDMTTVSVEDLLGRDPIKADMREVFDFINGKVVLVTGGGGSIGSELCRQIAAHNPKQLIIFDVYENNAYAIQLELKEKYPGVNVVTLIGSVRDSRRIFAVFDEYRPEIVYHAAAHKHVPLMEDSPCEAIKNNAIGTYKTAYAAMLHGCERFVLISTDKAVNPTNIMGASKRLCEMIIQSFDAKIKAGKAAEIPQLFTHFCDENNIDKEKSIYDFKNIKTEFVAVRFGNVLGSNGSVIPVFKKQIEKGGPVTVTHPDIIRYFMTIPEAVSLVMLAGTYAHGGEIFVLDMGSPVKIDTLARNLIKLSGYRPDIDIKIVYSGLRPGEKLYEEKLMAEEGLKKTENDLILIGCPIPFDVDMFLTQLDGLMTAAYDNKKDIRSRVAEVVSTYHPANAPVTMVKDNKYVAMVAGDHK
jgi:FlaA1/EpsC-like NDP-sugar epimerase